MTQRGKLIADPLFPTVDDQRSLGRARLAVDEEPIQPVFITVGAHAKSLSNGRPVAVVGRPAYREWKSEDGSRRSRDRVVGRVQFGGQADDQAAGSDTEEGPAA